MTATYAALEPLLEQLATIQDAKTANFHQWEDAPAADRDWLHAEWNRLDAEERATAHKIYNQAKGVGA